MKLLAQALIIAGLAGSVVYPAAAQEKKAAQKAPPAEATDPVCGMSVETKTAEKTDYKGKTYYFCSKEDKAEFVKTPDKFAKDTKKQ